MLIANTMAELAAGFLSRKARESAPNTPTTILSLKDLAATCQKKDWANHKAKCGQQPPSPNSVTQVDVRVDAAMRNVGDQLVAGMRHALANAGVAETRSRVFGPVRLPM